MCMVFTRHNPSRMLLSRLLHILLSIPIGRNSEVCPLRRYIIKVQLGKKRKIGHYTTLEMCQEFVLMV
jgi:hypothetical protein